MCRRPPMRSRASSTTTRRPVFVWRVSVCVVWVSVCEGDRSFLPAADSPSTPTGGGEVLRGGEAGDSGADDDDIGGLRRVFGGAIADQKQQERSC